MWARFSSLPADDPETATAKPRPPGAASGKEVLGPYVDSAAQSGPGKVWFFKSFLNRAGGSGGPREAPLDYPWAFPGPPEATRA